MTFRYEKVLTVSQAAERQHIYSPRRRESHEYYPIVDMTFLYH